VSARSRAHPWFRSEADWLAACHAWEDRVFPGQFRVQGSVVFYTDRHNPPQWPRAFFAWPGGIHPAPCPCGVHACPDLDEHRELQELFGQTIDLWTGGANLSPAEMLERVQDKKP